jgi:uncharacterized protein YggU (UPF0235/DUF167 family)
MARSKDTEKAALAALAVRGAELAVRVTPNAGRNRVVAEAGVIRIAVTAPPAEGAANAAATRLLARALGVAPSRLVLIRGAAARDKCFRLD